MAHADMMQLVELAYACALDAKAWDLLLVQVATALHAIQPALFTHDSRMATGNPLCAPQLDQAYRCAYRDHFSQRNILLQRNRARLEPGSIRTSANMLPRGEFVRSEYYNDFCRPIDMDHSLAATVEARGPFSFNVCFWRPATSPDFQPEDFALLEVLLPHLRRVLAVGELVGHARQEAAFASLLGSRLSLAVIGVDANGRACWTNDEAERLFRAGDGLSAERGELRACTSAATAALRAAVQAATHRTLATADGEFPIALPRPSARRPYAVVVMPLHHDQPSLWDDGAIRALVVVADPERSPRISRRLLSHQFGLTAAEARVAALMARGRAVEDICAELAVSENTLRTHLKHIYMKTGTARQAELVALIAGTLGPWAADPKAEDAAPPCATVATSDVRAQRTPPPRR